MFKKWRSCLLSVLLVFCMFFGLSSNTLQVEAAVSEMNFTTTLNVTIEYSVDDNNYSVVTGSSTVSSGGGYFNDGTGSISVSGSGRVSTTIGSSERAIDADITVPFSIGGNFVGDLDLNTIRRYCIYPTGNISASNGIVSNFYILDKANKLVSSGVPTSLDSVTWNEIKTIDFYSANGKVNYQGFLKFHFNRSGLYQNDYSTTFSIPIRLYFSNDISGNNAAVIVSDVSANQSLDAIEQSSQDIATSVTSDTGGGLLATIKNFFGGFFSNLINSILGLFVPSSDYFSTWFSNLNTLLSDKLGMLYAPFDLLISTLNAIYSADTIEPGIVFPGFEWDGQTVIEPYTFYFSSLGEQFQTLREAVYFSTDVIFLFAFLYLMQKKIALVLTGSEVNG